MAFIPVPGGIELRLKWSISGGFVYNILVVSKDGTVVIGDLTDAIAVVTDWWTDNSADTLFSNDTELVEIQATDVSVADSIQSIASLSGYVGSIDSDPISLNSGLVSSWRTDRIGRSYRGRNYWAGFPETYSNGRQISGSPLLGFSNSMAALLDAFDTASLPLVVASKYHLGAPRSTAVVTPVTHVIVNSGLDTQRRRLAQ